MICYKVHNWCVWVILTLKMNKSNFRKRGYQLHLLLAWAWKSSDNFFACIKRCAKKIHILWYRCRHRGWRGKMVLREKTVKKWKLRGLRLRGLMWNHMSTPCFIYENDQHKKLNILSGFENKIPTHMVATHAISKSEWKFRNRIPEELDQKLVWDNSLLEMLMIVLGHQLQVAISTRR